MNKQDTFDDIANAGMGLALSAVQYNCDQECSLQTEPCEWCFASATTLSASMAYLVMAGHSELALDLAHGFSGKEKMEVSK